MAQVDPVFNILIFNCNTENTKHPYLLAGAWDLTPISYFGRSTAKEYMIFAAREIMGRTSIAGQRLTVPYKVDPLNKTYQLHSTKNKDGVGAIAITEESYKPRLAHDLLQLGLKEFYAALENQKKPLNALVSETKDQDFKVPKLAEYLAKFQKPSDVDQIGQIHKDLDETKEILMKSIDQLLERGERLADLMDKSEDLSFASKQYYDKARDLNGCWGWCNII